MGDAGYIGAWPPYSTSDMLGHADIHHHRIDGEASAQMAEFMANLSGHLSIHVRTLQSQCQTLQHRVAELEQWKRNTSQEMRKLREQHALARKQLAQLRGEPEQEEMRRAASLPTPSIVTSGGWATPPARPSLEHAKSMPLMGVPGLHDAEVGPPPGLGSPVVALPAVASKPLQDNPVFGNLTPVSNRIAPLPGDIETAPIVKDGVEVNVSEDASVTVVEWRIAHMTKRLKDCMGRPIVSSPFNAWDIQGMLLMICPDGGDGSRGRTRRQKQIYNTKVSDGSMEASVKLKVADCPHELTYNVQIGDVERGPFKHNFAEGIVSDYVDLGIDFLSKLELDGGLLVRVSIKAPAPVQDTQATVA
mmetsp:Transcript_72339/g.172396  ORF Transcript_72339/g.172396 Transcript_72339/m.172396 type:complete len:361 (+) Transcript_72339:75-1157(+)